MNKLVIKTHNFEKAKNQIKKFSKTKPEELALRKVEVDGGLFNWFDHKVTGQELNALTNQVQDYLIKFNTLNTKFIKEFGEVYNALEALDKEYIQAILISIKAAEEASMEAKDAQKDINKTIEKQKQTIVALKKFKDKLDKYEHLANIDDLWEDAQTFSGKIKIVNTQIRDINKLVKAQDKEVASLNQFKEELEKYKHLRDIDKIWEDTQTISTTIISLNSEIEKLNKLIKVQNNNLDTLNQFKEELDKQKHLGDIDQLWEDSQKSKEDVDSLQQKVVVLEYQLGEAKQQMSDDKAKNESNINSLSKKIRTAYALAGASIGIVLIQFVLNILGIL